MSPRGHPSLGQFPNACPNKSTAPQVQEALETQKEEFARREELFKRREEALRKQDLELQQQLIRFNKFLQVGF